MPDARHSPEPPLASDGSPAGVAEGLHRSAIKLLRRLRTEDRRSGLSGPRASALSVLVFGGPITLGALAAAEQVRPPTMSRLVSAMEADGLLVREGDAQDARLVRVRASAKGIRLLHAARARRLARLQVALETLSPGELATLDEAAELIERVVHVL